MRVAVVGTRDYPSMAKVHEYLRGLHEWTTVVSGGRGHVDQAAEGSTLHWVSFRPIKVPGGFGIKRIEVEDDGWDGEERVEERVGGLRPTWPAAAFYRNEFVIGEADEVKAFWDGKSKGTKHAIDIALRDHVNIEVIFP